MKRILLLLNLLLSPLLKLLSLSLLSQLLCLNAVAETRAISSQHHITAITVPDDMQLPADYPLDHANRLQCQTCHQADIFTEYDHYRSTLKKDERNQDDYRKLINKLKEYDQQANDFLRDQGQKALGEFCYRCHQKEENQAQNIHIMLDKQGKAIKENCSFCHKEPLQAEDFYSPQSQSRIGNLQQIDDSLRLPPETLCIGCHLRTPHLNAQLHLVNLDSDMINKIRNYEVRHNLRLPLNQKNSITCVTCHTPHQQGVLHASNPSAGRTDDSSLEQGITYASHPWAATVKKDKAERLDKLGIDNKAMPEYRQIQHEVLLRLPAKDGSLCFVCHEFDL